MRLIIHGQQAFGKSVLERLVERGENVVAAYTAPDCGPRSDPLKEYGESLGLPVFQPASFKPPEAARQLQELAADLCIMAYVTLFVPSAFLNAPQLGTIQYHPSLLPDHKGPSSINWPIIYGKTETGLSIFWPDDGLDTGPILLQKKVSIDPDDTLGSLYFNQLYPLGVDAMIDALDLVRDGRAPKTAQDSSAGSYESWCGKDAAKIDWNRPAGEVYNLIRGTNPQPGAWTTRNGNVIQIFDCRKSARTDGAPGEVVEMGEAGFTVAALDGSIEVQRVRAGAGKIQASEYAAEARLEPGARFGS